MAHLAAQSPGAAAPRFDYLCSTTRTQLEERSRLAHEHAPSAARDRAITRNLYTLADALGAWRSEHGAALEPWRARVLALVDDFGSAELRAHPGLAPPAPPAPPAPAHAELIDDVAEPAEHEDTVVYVPPPELAEHHEAMDEQDSRLDLLSASIARQHTLSVQMNDELEMQSGLIAGLDGDVEQTGLRLGGAGTQLERLGRRAGDHRSLLVIFALIIVLVLLIALVK